jgi:hypothetical protein
MNKNLNLVDILKDCPRGTKLYSTVYGEVEFEGIHIDTDYKTDYPITFKYKDEDGYDSIETTTIDGKQVCFANGECTLFPAKDQRDWSKFKIEPELVDGEFYYCVYGGNKKENSFIFIYKKHTSCKTRYYVALSMLSSVLFKDDTITQNPIELRKATEEEKQQLLDAIKVRNYEWDADKKELIKIEPKFDISTLQHFNRVLVRGTNGEPWSIDFFSHIIKNDDIKSPIFCCMCSVPQQCIPYNKETKYLVGKIKMPHKKYITWEE